MDKCEKCGLPTEVEITSTEGICDRLMAACWETDGGDCLRRQLASREERIASLEAENVGLRAVMEKTLDQLKADYPSGSIAIDDPHYLLYHDIRAALSSPPSPIEAIVKAAVEWEKLQGVFVTCVIECEEDELNKKALWLADKENAVNRLLEAVRAWKEGRS